MSKVALVTGASSGIGQAIAARLLADGFVVYGGARRVERMADLAAKGATTLALDVTDAASAQAAVDTILKDHGRLDVLINNAGYGSFGAIEDVPLDEARRQFDVNVFGLAQITKLVLPQMRQQRAGTIVNISSMGGKLTTPLGGWYHASKFALEGWSDCLRFELRPFGIDVVVVEPGGIETEFMDVVHDQLDKTSEGGAYQPLVDGLRRAERRMGKLSKPEVIADVVSRAARAARPKTRYATGAGARPFLFLRRWMSDRQYDWLLRRMTA